jgi:hypothetical protein
MHGMNCIGIVCRRVSMLKDLVEYIVKKLVDKPDRVSVSEITGEQSTIIVLRVAPEVLEILE